MSEVGSPQRQRLCFTCPELMYACAVSNSCTVEKRGGGGGREGRRDGKRGKEEGRKGEGGREGEREGVLKKRNDGVL